QNVPAPLERRTASSTGLFSNRSRANRRRARAKMTCDGVLPTVEALGERMMFSITATFTAASGELKILGDTQPNSIVVSRVVGGGAGNDNISLGGGIDAFQWNPGNGSDIVDGGLGSDSMVLNGSDLNESFNITPNGNHVSLTRDVGSVTMDLSGLEEIELNP